MSSKFIVVEKFYPEHEKGHQVTINVDHILSVEIFERQRWV